MSQHGSNTSTFKGHLEDDNHLGDAPEGSPIQIPPVDRNRAFYITTMMFYFV